MALNSSRSVWSASRQALRPLRPLRTPVARPTPACRANSHLAREPTSLVEKNDPLNEPVTEEDVEEARPRWSYTPEGLKGAHGFSLNKIKVPHRAIWHVNEDPAKLDEFYERFLGRNGSRMLPEEVKWLAVTHKSFDYGRRGFNTRLAYFGRQIMVHEAMNEIMTSTHLTENELTDPWNRKPFESPALQNVDKLSTTRPQDVMSVSDLAAVAINLRLNEVVRWKPRNPDNLKGSGIETALATSIFAIVGAVALQNGGEVASKLAREKVLRRIVR
ncbi:hypothetical protein VM1G_06321 [Cytospora mali]|uniref:RNase III domain-containing protein n=1 Tax=Cytospora mali TaxID=578113 RepID=A0A194W2E5_CYTMA|nr:hypothetical protein VM1G_06321 [Valsa mali]